MSKAIENLLNAQQFAMSIRSQIGGFPYLAEALRKAGITRNIWNLPSCQSIYLTEYGSVVSQGTPLVNTTVDIPLFDREALIKALRIDQAGQSSFPEFLKASWEAGVVSYIVDFKKRVVIYYGVLGESYSEDYPAVEIG
ncbi:conserved hypothetical protein [Candidatus Protochlamydia naegleriophila]|uniref:Phage envelope protein n=1 Tax=Candidatus Protochlamydia naegleriophila TaxID=389348 RepID=A0A0U5JEH3_9BACT|nr:DUF1398 family protein [Candidatus Protochlamydia naegleriophila]CUI17188.1 conserved hypothetical protein [Candidatus Protochlamydia naegleriophila]